MLQSPQASLTRANAFDRLLPVTFRPQALDHLHKRRYTKLEIVYSLACSQMLRCEDIVYAEGRAI